MARKQEEPMLEAVEMVTEFADQARCVAAALAPGSVAGERGAYAVVPDGWRVEPLAHLQDRPNRISTDLAFRTTKALATYVDRFRQPETLLFSAPNEFAIRAEIDYHSATDGPSHCAHVARFCAQFHPAYEAWRTIHGKMMGQVQAGLFLEERAVDVIEPDAAAIFEMVMQFDALTRVTFRQSTRLHDGSRQFTYTEEAEARGSVTLPERITLLLPVFEGQDPQRIVVRLRYRIEEGKLRFAFEVHDKAMMELRAFQRCEDALLSELAAPLPLLPVCAGS